MLKKLLSLSVAMSLLFGACQALSGVSGNYWRSCRRCSYVQGVLKCRCLKRNGVRRWSKLKVSDRCLFVENQNGRLRCTQFAPKLIPPRKPRYKTFVVRFKGASGWNQESYRAQCRRACRLIDRSWKGQSFAKRTSKRRVSCSCF